MKIYEASTTYQGADRPSRTYYSTEAKALDFIRSQDNGEVEEMEVNIDSLPHEGCTWDDISYWMNA